MDKKLGDMCLIPRHCLRGSAKDIIPIFAERRRRNLGMTAFSVIPYLCKTAR